MSLQKNKNKKKKEEKEEGKKAGESRKEEGKEGRECCLFNRSPSLLVVLMVAQGSVLRGGDPTVLSWRRDR